MVVTEQPRIGKAWSPCGRRENWQDYYVVREPEAGYANYWGQSSDPDGRLRQRDSEEERTHYLADCWEEIAHVNSLEPLSVLDVGAGLGWFLSAIDADVRAAIEIAPQAIERLRSLGYAVYEELVEIADASFDCVVAHHVIEHIQDPIGAINHIRRVLHPGGHLVISTPDFGSPCAVRFGTRYRTRSDALQSFHVGIAASVFAGLRFRGGSRGIPIPCEVRDGSHYGSLERHARHQPSVARKLGHLLLQEGLGVITTYYPTANGWREMLSHKRLLKECCERTKHLPGNAAEIGVWRGEGAEVILENTDCRVYLLDTYDGMPAEMVIAECDFHKAKAFKDTSLETVAVAVARFGSRAVLVPGVFPYSGHDITDPLRFVHIDCDLYLSTKYALARAEKRLVPGGVILCDDYGCGTTQGARKAIDEWLQAHRDWSMTIDDDRAILGRPVE